MEIQYLLRLCHSCWSMGRCKFDFSSICHDVANLRQLFAYALANMAGIAGYNGWRWIFIIEGLLTVVVAALGKFFIVDWPETSKFLNPEERALLLRRLREETAEARMDTLDKKATKRILTDWKIYVGYDLCSHKYLGLS